MLCDACVLSQQQSDSKLRCGCPQVQLQEPAKCLDAMFLFSLVWSVGASCDNSSRAKFDAFLRALVGGKVAASHERADYDLGPGIEIKYPAQLLQVAVPEVGELSCQSVLPSDLACCWVWCVRVT
jgi:hypothetical protein